LSFLRHFRAITATVMLLTTLTAIGQSSSAKDTAVALLQKGDFAGALALADQALQQNPRDCRMLTIRGIALKRSAKNAEASGDFAKAASLCPTFVPALEGLAELQYAQQSPEAADTLQKLLILQPANQTSHAMLAVIEARNGNCSAAVKHFAQAASLIRSSTDAMGQYASCLLATDEPEQARDIFRQLLDKQDTSGNRLRYAYACWKAKDYADGLQALSPLLQGALPAPESLTLGARLAESAGDTPRAVDLLQKAIAARPMDEQNYLIFAEISFNHASYKVGIDMLNAGLARLPQEPRLYLARGVLEVQQSKFDAALADFRKAHQLDPDLSLAGDAMGIMLDQRHQTAESLAAYAAQAKAHPEDALVHYLYAEALSQSDPAMKNGAQAIEAARRAVALEPNYQPALDLLCQLEVRAGNLDKALEVAHKAIARNPDDEAAIYQEMMVYRRLGKKDEVNQLVAKLKQLKEHQQNTKTNYQLQEIGTRE
jgi:tetratricopeptide (TPR) repeat protein